MSGLFERGGFLPILSIGMPYYRNPGMLAIQLATWAAYPEALKAQIEILIVDDDSPEPAADVPRPSGLPTLRIWRFLPADSEPPWRQHAGRNLAALRAEAPWLLLTDMDHVLPAESLATLLEYLHLGRDDAVYQFRRLDAPDMRPKLKDGRPHPHTNTYAVRRAFYWKHGGYDEDLVGYGTDSYFLRRLKMNGTTVLHDAPIVRYAREVQPDASTVVDRLAARRREHNDAMLRRKARESAPPTVLSIPHAQVFP